jgi:hypothetical protein
MAVALCSPVTSANITQSHLRLQSSCCCWSLYSLHQQHHTCTPAWHHLSGPLEGPEVHAEVINAQHAWTACSHTAMHMAQQQLKRNSPVYPSCAEPPIPRMQHHCWVSSRDPLCSRSIDCQLHAAQSCTCHHPFKHVRFTNNKTPESKQHNTQAALHTL